MASRFLSSVDVDPAAATGNVAISNDLSTRGLFSSTSQLSLPLSNGVAKGSWVGFPGGTYNVYANYGGDANYGGSVSGADGDHGHSGRQRPRIVCHGRGYEWQHEQPGRKDCDLWNVYLGRCSAGREVAGFKSQSAEECNWNGGIHRHESEWSSWERDAGCGRKCGVSIAFSRRRNSYHFCVAIGAITAITRAHPRASRSL